MHPISVNFKIHLLFLGTSCFRCWEAGTARHCPRAACRRHIPRCVCSLAKAGGCSGADWAAI